jgi:hypothetical protein
MAWAGGVISLESLQDRTVRIMTDVSLDAAAKKTLLRKIPHGLFI